MGIGAHIVIWITFALGLLLMALRLPTGAPELMVWGRPDWVALMLLYWVLALPHGVGLFTAWLLGLLLDSVSGSILGQHALLLTLIAWIGLSLYERLRMYSLLQQSMVVFAILAFAALLGAGLERVVRGADFTLLVLVSPLVSAMIWPLLFLALRRLRRAFGIT